MKLIFKNIYLVLLSFILVIPSFAQDCTLPNHFVGTAGVNMTVNFNQSFLSSLTINDESSYIIATSPENVVVGSTEVFGLNSTSMVIWGSSVNNELGASVNDTIKFQLVQNNIIYDIYIPEVIIYTDNTSHDLETSALIYVYCDTNSLQDEIYGCSDSLSINYDSLATYNDLSCIPIIAGCNNPLYLEYQEGLNTLDTLACQTLISYGCLNSYACNYNEAAHVEDNSCVYAEPNLDCNGNCLVDSDLDGICDLDEIYGCNDTTYLDFNPNATENDGTCDTLITFGCMYSDFFEYNPLATNNDGSCDSVIVEGCMDSTYFDFNPNANAPQDCVVPVILGCLNSTFLEYDSLANVSDSTCFDLVVYGCLNNAYLEYDSLANSSPENNMCLNLIVEGCTDNLACNYNELANVGDQSCYVFDMNLSFDDDEMIIEVETNASNPSYNWTYSIGGDTESIENQSAVHTPQGNGSYTIEVVDEYGCSLIEQINLFTLQTVEMAKYNSSVYPNPALDVINFSNTEMITSIEIINLYGEIIYITNSPKSKINISFLEPGNYVSKLIGIKGVSYVSFIKY